MLNYLVYKLTIFVRNTRFSYDYIVFDQFQWGLWACANVWNDLFT